MSTIFFLVFPALLAGVAMLMGPTGTGSGGTGSAGTGSAAMGATGAGSGPASQPHAQREAHLLPQGQNLRLDTPSGQPVPRFVSLKGPEDYCRMGPSWEHAVRYTYQRPGLPVMVIAESRDNWRKIRDAAGDECWAYRSRLTNLSHLLARGDTDLRRAPQTEAPLRGRIGDGVLARIVRVRNGWALVEAGDIRGWARLDAFWGGGAFSE